MNFLHKSWKEERDSFINSWVFFTFIYFEIISRSSNNKKSEHCLPLIQFSLRHRWTRYHNSQKKHTVSPSQPNLHICTFAVSKRKEFCNGTAKLFHIHDFDLINNKAIQL